MELSIASPGREIGAAPMLATVCTLFEGHYHHGVGALVNSLYRNGFRGVVWAGYRGSLPHWATGIKATADYQELPVAHGCVIRFVPLATERHFTDYKAEFMLNLWRRFAPDSDAMFYFDPDIVVKCPWSFYEEWVTFGVALCEDVNSPMPATHPFRIAWRQMYEPKGFLFLNRDVDVYVNAGFVGLTRERRRFLEQWQNIMDIMMPPFTARRPAGVRRAFLGQGGGEGLVFQQRPGDQDALNIAVMCAEDTISLMGKEAMDIIPGGWTMSHAWGAKKPWRRNLMLDALLGLGLRRADREFWKYTQHPIKIYSDVKVFWKRLEVKSAAAISRLIKTT